MPAAPSMRYALLLALAGALATLPAAHGDAIELTEKDFEEKVFNGKFSFVKFYAPWCGHCKKIKPDWDKLADAWNKPDKNAQIFDVDCISDGGKPLCEKYGVSGYPTLKYFSKDTTDQGQSYEGGREYSDLKKFVKKESKPPCIVATLQNCNKKEKAFIQEMNAMEEAKIEEEKTRMKGLLGEAAAKKKAEDDLFEEQKEVAMATMKRAEEAKKELEKLTSTTKYKINILEQGTSPETEKAEL
mmetsp:Transcript_23329/g.51538  ORF Transcript_23329/g.51538 Transcript_23329/m.51538 type:complete len:243 (-) Transcript_23329:507-1235(-)|eukprot:CAMPEP_0170612344 /NCGR_PEP_ID=MMETSP0224-20130122/23673_1 /TAXON_ID=285029 /ORGANISM="Togula jolla, Strain CCCM 725" /LENGTH=242 /DNA_ID=CAMNT_0010937841 /DNA_START=37 /DNA_END=765 /DNA_ORIENTATION=-